MPRQRKITVPSRRNATAKQERDNSRKDFFSPIFFRRSTDKMCIRDRNGGGDRQRHTSGAFPKNRYQKAPAPHNWKLAQQKYLLSVSYTHLTTLYPTRKPRRLSNRFSLCLLAACVCAKSKNGLRKTKSVSYTHLQMRHGCRKCRCCGSI